ncbi:FAD-dependent oxidoreductase [Marinobacter salinus]|uniref:FAD-dependent oxidoreductase n=1 Tax=Marinobacter salinus TaxID=1874317 RepID=A0A1D9GJH6_9GAMM|nr:FAD-dependent oxidoreductase [Marinobacter salinus]AOY87635.1 FAD-dependent oxidoreductase [Marinobacter salinus]
MFNETSQVPHIRRVAIVGSGLSGLTAAIILQAHGYDVTVFEKSRGPGGRLASKRVGEGSADIGAQYFTARNPDFIPFLRQYAGKETFEVWHGRFGFRNAGEEWSRFPEEPRYVGTPRMTAISRALSGHVNVVANTRVGKLARKDTGWIVTDEGGKPLGDFEHVIITAPPAQARDLLKGSGLEGLATHLDEPIQHLLPCWAVAAHFEQAPWSRHEGMRVEHPVLFWVANNTSKPGRDDSGQWWVLHASPEWSEEHVETPADQVAAELIGAFGEVTGFDGQPDNVVTHRWLYARSEGGHQPGHLWFSQEGIGIAGDWLSGGRVEGAFNSASSLVRAMMP